MPSFAEIMAAKKAAAAQNNSGVSNTPAIQAPQPTLQQTIAEAAPAQKTPEPFQNESDAIKAFGRPLTFKEKLELKAGKLFPPAVTAASAPVEAPKESSLASLSEATASIVRSPAREIPIVSEDTTVQQNYVDIRRKIDELETLSGDGLKSGMAELKKALMANPSACELMLDEDVGVMVTQLRRMTMQDVVEVEKDGKAKKPKALKMKDLSVEEMMAAMEEL